MMYSVDAKNDLLSTLPALFIDCSGINIGNDICFDFDGYFIIAVLVKHMPERKRKGERERE